MPRIIAVIGAADAAFEQSAAARACGALIAQRGWILITGGLGGVMEAASQGAAEAGGIVVGILPGGETRQANPYVTIPIATNMGHARNVIIAHTADACIAVGGACGTLSEIAIARKLGKPVFSLESWEIAGTTAVKTAREAIEQCNAYFRS